MLEYDREYGLTEDEAGWRRRAAAFANEQLAPNAREADRSGTFSREQIETLGAAGLIGATLPRDAGGGGASPLAGCAIAEEIGAVDGSVRGFLAVQVGLVLSAFLRHAHDEHRARWVPDLVTGRAIGAYALTEPEAGSDVAALQTRVRAEGDDVVLHGEKIWITNGGVADVILVFGTVDPALGREGITCYWVPGDAAGLEREPMPGRELGHRASDHARLRLDGVRVPRENRIGPERGGFAVAMGALDVGRLNVAAGAVGVHRACLDASVAYARTRRQFGKRLGDHQQVGATLADVAMELRAARLLTHHAARLVERGWEARDAVSTAKLFATEAALRAATRAIQLHGARGYTDDLPLERHYRDVIALTIYEGTSNIQRLILARGLLGKDEARTK